MKGTWWPSVPVYRIYTKWILCLLRSLLASSNKLSISKSDTRWDSLWLLTFSRLCDDLTNSSFVRKWEKCPWLKKLLPLDAPEAAVWFLDASQMNQITTSLTFKALSSPFSPFRVVGSIKRVICYFGSSMQLGHCDLCYGHSKPRKMMTAQTYSQFSRTFIKWKVFDSIIKKIQCLCIKGAH